MKIPNRFLPGLFHKLPVLSAIIALRVSQVAFFLTIILTGPVVNAQCSDAGVCSIGAHGAGEESGRKFFAAVEYLYGMGSSQEDVSYNSALLKAGWQFLPETSVRAEFTVFKSQSGPLGNADGVGDLILLLSHNLLSLTGTRLSLEAGMRIATGDENIKPALPMSYQNGLGTNDLLVGLNYTTGNIGFSAGYQMAEKIYNGNSFTRLKRGDDISLQAYYNTRLNPLRLRGELLLIKRLKDSEILLPSGGSAVIPNSSKAQLNLGASAGYLINNLYEVYLGAAIPLLKRDVNIDGLTRKLSIYAGFMTGF